MNPLQKLILTLVLWLPVSLAALAAIPLALLGLWFDKTVYAKQVLKAMDRVAAAVLGWSGDFTVSAECGKSECRFCKALCGLLNLIDKGHCKKVSRREGV